MTTKFSSKQEALERGIFYAGMHGKTKVKNLKKREDVDIEQIFGRINAEIYELKNCKGVNCMIGTSQFRDGYDLWLITVEGFAQRV